jgi:TPR repeat protein
MTYKKKAKELTADFTLDAIELMQKADAGDAEAQYTFATYLLKEPDFSYRKDIPSDDVERGMRYLQKAATQGHFHGIAADELSMIYYRGEIVTQDYGKAKMWFNTALLSGIPTAAYMLGECAYYGYDEDLDYEKAAKYYLQAASGYINALIRIGDMYLHGEYFPKDPGFAKELYEHVRASEEWLYKRNRFYSSANEAVLHRLDNMERTDITYHSSISKESEEQRKARKKLLDIIKKKTEKWENGA